MVASAPARTPRWARVPALTALSPPSLAPHAVLCPAPPRQTPGVLQLSYSCPCPQLCPLLYPILAPICIPDFIPVPIPIPMPVFSSSSSSLFPFLFPSPIHGPLHPQSLPLSLPPSCLFPPPIPIPVSFSTVDAIPISILASILTLSSTPSPTPPPSQSSSLSPSPSPSLMAVSLPAVSQPPLCCPQTFRLEIDVMDRRGQNCSGAVTVEVRPSSRPRVTIL